jgi:hypothetical protein
LVLKSNLRYFNYGLGSDDDCEIETYFEEWKENIWAEITPIYANLKIGEIKNELKKTEALQLSPKVKLEEKSLCPLTDCFKQNDHDNFDLNVRRILFECKTMELIKVEKLKTNESKTDHLHNCLI